MSTNRGAGAQAGLRTGPSIWLAAPAMTFFAIFALIPLLGVVALSFMNWDGLNNPGFVGGENWTRILTDPVTLNAMKLSVNEVRADAELRPPLRELIECRDDLGEQSRMAVRDAGDHEPEPNPLGVRGGEAQGGVALQHRLGRPTVDLHLEVVVHTRQQRRATLLGGFGRTGEVVGDRRATGRGEAGAVDTDVHVAIMLPHPHDGA